MSDAPDDLAAIGDVVRPHGVRGELVIEPAGPAIAEIAAGTVVWVGEELGARVVEGLRPHRSRWLLRLAGIDDRDAAETLRGATLRVPADTLPTTGGNEFYVHDLLGCVVRRADGTRLGEIVRVIQRSPHDLMEIEADRRTVLVPMVRDWVVEIDLAGRRIIVDLPEGLEESTALGG